MRFGRFVGLIISPLFIPAFYRDVARNWGGIGFLYLLLLFTITWIPVLAQWQLAFQKKAADEFPKIAKDIPDIKLQGGKVSSKVAQPFEIKDKIGNVVFVLDTTGKIKTLDDAPKSCDILITETKMHQRDPSTGRIQITDLSQIPWDIDFSADVVQDWIDIIGTWMGVALYPIMMIGSLVRALFIMLIASVLGLIFNAAFNAKVSYAGLLRLGAVGLTLSVYVDTGLMLAGISVPFRFFIALGVTCIYVGYGTAVSAPPPPEFAEGDDREHRRSRLDDYDDEDGPPPPYSKSPPDTGIQDRT